MSTLITLLRSSILTYLLNQEFFLPQAVHDRKDNVLLNDYECKLKEQSTELKSLREENIVLREKKAVLVDRNETLKAKLTKTKDKLTALGSQLETTKDNTEPVQFKEEYERLKEKAEHEINEWRERCFIAEGKNDVFVQKLQMYEAQIRELQQQQAKWSMLSMYDAEQRCRCDLLNFFLWIVRYFKNKKNPQTHSN